MFFVVQMFCKFSNTSWNDIIDSKLLFHDHLDKLLTKVRKAIGRVEQLAYVAYICMPTFIGMHMTRMLTISLQFLKVFLFL